MLVTMDTEPRLFLPDALCAGEALWDRIPGGAVPGGAPANVAYHLAQWGLRAELCTAFGRDAEGDALERVLHGAGLGMACVQRNGLPTGAVDVRVAGDEVEYTIAEPAAWDGIEAEGRLLDTARRARWVVLGTLARRREPSAGALLDVAREAEGRVVLDVNWRGPFDRVETVLEMLPYCGAVKFNRAEWRRFGGAMGWVEGEAEREFFLRFPANLLAVTHGAEGCVLRTRWDRVEARGPEVRGGDPVGAGDAFTAALVSGLHDGLSLAEVATRACKAGARVAGQRGAMVRSVPEGWTVPARRAGRVIVTAGAARSPLDGLRFISNPSTGELGARIADACARDGFEVELWTGAGSAVLPRSASVAVRRFGSNGDLLEGLRGSARRGGTVAVFHAAALADFEVGSVEDGEGHPVVAKKIASRGIAPVVRLGAAAKVLPEMRGLFPEAMIVGWKFEMDGGEGEAVERAREQVARGGSDVCLVNGPAFGEGYAAVGREGVLERIGDRSAVAAWCARSAARLPASRLNVRKRCFC